MATAVFVGDEVSAAGYRLCGVEVLIAGRRDAMALIEQACERASLVLIGSSTAADLTPAERDRLLATVQPPVLVVPDVRGLQRVPDLTAGVHRQLGMLE